MKNDAYIMAQKAQVEAHITASPDAKIGEITAYCVGTPDTEERVTADNDCVYTVRQLLYIEFPVTISVHTKSEPERLAESRQPLLPQAKPIPQLKAARPASAERRQRRPLLFVLLEGLQRRLFPRRG